MLAGLSFDFYQNEYLVKKALSEPKQRNSDEKFSEQNLIVNTQDETNQNQQQNNNQQTSSNPSNSSKKTKTSKKQLSEEELNRIAKENYENMDPKYRIENLTNYDTPNQGQIDQIKRLIERYNAELTDYQNKRGQYWAEIYELWEKMDDPNKTLEQYNYYYEEIDKLRAKIDDVDLQIWGLTSMIKDCENQIASLS